jgi:YfiR/HmsC-like
MPSILPTRFIASVAWLAMLPAVSLAGVDPEDELKAAVVLSFLRYGEWPQSPAVNTPLAVGVLGRASFADALRRTLEGKLVNDHSVRVVRLKTAAEAQGCQVVYFAADQSSFIKAALENGLPARVLTIGESKDFLDWGGAVNLLVVDGHMGFEVSMVALERSGVSISSRLLRFGQVRNQRKTGRS